MIKKIIIAALIIGSVSTAFAHSGGSDKNGGHYNRKTDQGYKL